MACDKINRLIAKIFLIDYPPKGVPWLFDKVILYQCFLHCCNAWLDGCTSVNWNLLLFPVCYQIIVLLIVDLWVLRLSLLLVSRRSICHFLYALSVQNISSYESASHYVSTVERTNYKPKQRTRGEIMMDRTQKWKFQKLIVICGNKHFPQNGFASRWSVMGERLFRKWT